MQEGQQAGTAFHSASEAVNHVREPSSNAFLYIGFHIRNRWILADHFRRLDETVAGEAEEKALRTALTIVRAKAKSGYAPPDLRSAARLLAQHPGLIEISRRILALEMDVNIWEH